MKRATHCLKTGKVVKYLFRSKMETSTDKFIYTLAFRTVSDCDFYVDTHLDEKDNFYYDLQQKIDVKHNVYLTVLTDKEL